MDVRFSTQTDSFDLAEDGETLLVRPGMLAHADLLKLAMILAPFAPTMVGLTKRVLTVL